MSVNIEEKHLQNFWNLRRKGLKSKENLFAQPKFTGFVYTKNFCDETFTLN
jgi:hypothetical protein